MYISIPFSALSTFSSIFWLSPLVLHAASKYLFLKILTCLVFSFNTVYIVTWQNTCWAMIQANLRAKRTIHAMLFTDGTIIHGVGHTLRMGCIGMPVWTSISVRQWYFFDLRARRSQHHQPILDIQDLQRSVAYALYSSEDSQNTPLLW